MSRMLPTLLALAFLVAPPAIAEEIDDLTYCHFSAQILHQAYLNRYDGMPRSENVAALQAFAGPYHEYFPEYLLVTTVDLVNSVILRIAPQSRDAAIRLALSEALRDQEGCIRRLY